MSTAASMRAQLDAEIADANEDERRVILYAAIAVARRMRLGREQYGALDLASDGRDWRHEIRSELADGMAYLAMMSLREPSGRAG